MPEDGDALGPPSLWTSDGTLITVGDGQPLSWTFGLMAYDKSYLIKAQTYLREKTDTTCLWEPAIKAKNNDLTDEPTAELSSDFPATKLMISNSCCC
ncbi:hypothetical protein MUK42_32988 [Musa troglodytarum]|uniref:Uncharacterized protein n=1 Tax=Musa troglodytarum TaxID=320322 RepID=A0A9E7KCG9_9LILI|nr:hypothetical protein MUK42_32988 [Musa troglodytarum]